MIIYVIWDDLGQSGDLRVKDFVVKEDVRDLGPGRTWQNGFRKLLTKSLETFGRNLAFPGAHTPNPP